ncbi:MAG: alpha/beta hydrolase [Cereibacter sphaeroides]|uniref:Alpha/beta hydrolase n=1 Tax=Cereibacter sphaeroides TaxID=1063 RepID=A0A2W5S4F6_CERSP|nr:MAG: alpha/beta hydrolase [Cereibacter sphaeroides]
MLNLIRHPAETPTDKPPLVIVHGLYGSGRNWGVIARRLASEREVIAVDQRNHGSSDWSDTHDYPAMAGDLAEVIAANGGWADVLGHSMGGKAAMVLALTHGEMVRRLVVADVAPVPYSHDQAQYVDAMQAVDLRGLTSRAEADARLAQYVDDPALRAFFLQSLDLKAEPPRWRLNLSVLKAEMPKIIGWPDVQGRFEKSVLFLSGAASHYVLPEYRPAIRALFPHAHFAKLPGAGHWLHAEKPREFEETVRVFLDA